VIDHITQSKISKYQCPIDKKQFRVYMDDRTGLNLYITRNGSRTWDHQFKIPATKTTGHYKIGDARITTVNEAKDIIVDLRRLVAKGIDPRDQKKESEAIPTFTAFMEEHYLPYVQSRKRSAKRDEQIYRIHAKPALKDLPINKITRKKIITLHTELFDKGYAPATCDHVVKLIRHALNLGVEWEMLESSPASKLPLYNVDNRVNNVLTPESLARLMHVLRSDPNQNVSRIVQFLLATGIRLGSALKIKWSDLDLERMILRIDATNSKSRTSHSLPINNVAAKIILECKNEFEYVFANPKTGLPYVQIFRAWDRIRKKSGVPNFRLHDCRHQAATAAIEGGNSLYIVQQLLNHSDPRTSLRYLHPSMETMRIASASISTRLSEAMKVTSEDN
jgi:integrase